MNFKNNKGITLMAEVITIIIFIIIISIITYSSTSSLQVKELNNMYTDIVNIQEKAANYYLKYGETPIESSSKVSSSVIPDDQRNPNDDEYSYYKVDFSKLLNITLNNKQTTDEYYIINTKTLSTYYSKGVTIDNLNGEEEEKTYYTIPANYESVSEIDVSQFQTEK